MVGRVAIAGLGYTAFTATSPGTSFRELTYEAAVKAYNEVGIDPKDIDTFVCTSEDFCEGYSISDEYCNDQVGAVLKPVQTIAGDALHSLATGAMLVMTGEFDVVAVQALSKMSNMKTIPNMVNFAMDPVLTRPLDEYYPFVSGLGMQRYIYDGKATPDQCAKVVVKNRANALDNPVAAYGADLTVRNVLDSEPVAEPLTSLEMAESADGAIVLVICSEKMVKSLTDKPVWLTGLGWASDAPSLDSRDWNEDIATKLAGEMAYKTAGINYPAKELDIVEVTDEIAYKELQHLEALRLFEPGQAGLALEDGRTSREGDVPVNVSGGDLGVGHLFEASGLQKAMEIVLQLRGEAGKRQIADAHTGLAQAWRGDPTTSAVVAVMANE